MIDLGVIDVVGGEWQWIRSAVSGGVGQQRAGNAVKSPERIDESGPAMTVLVVDDDEGSLLVAKAAVERSGHECIVAADGDTAWELGRGLSLARLVRDVTADLRLGLGEAGAVVECEDFDFDADESQLRVALQNLIHNAVAYRRPGIPPLIRIVGERSGAGVVGA